MRKLTEINNTRDVTNTNSKEIFAQNIYNSG